MSTTVALPEIDEEIREGEGTSEQTERLYHVILLDDNDHTSAVRGKSRHRTVSLDRSMSYGLFCPGTI